jgi:hypothetical protein
VVIHQLWLLAESGPSLASVPAAPAPAVDMMGARVFAKRYRATGVAS